MHKMEILFSIQDYIPKFSISFQVWIKPLSKIPSPVIHVKENYLHQLKKEFDLIIQLIESL